MRPSFVARVAVLCTALLLTAVSAHAGTYFTANLSGSQEVPPVVTPGTGFAACVLDDAETMLTIYLSASGLTSAITDSHIHRAPRGTNGAVVFGIGPFAGSIVATWLLTPADVVELKSGHLYVNVHTVTFPAGEIRGQISSGLYSAIADEGEEVPPTGSPGLAFVMTDLNPSEDTLHIDIKVKGLSGPLTNSHIHMAPVGANGPVVFAIGPFADSIKVDWPLTPTDVASLETGNLYFNGHTAAFPGGEIRGQLQPSTPYNARLDGGQEVPPVPTPGTGVGKALLNAAGTELHVYLSARGLTGPITNSHIHRAPVGVNGPVVFGIGPFTGFTMAQWNLTAVDITDLRAGNLYFNVHTTTFAGGEIRGQIGLLSTSVPSIGAATVPVSSIEISPNPMPGSGLIRFDLATQMRAELAIYDVAGRRVRALGSGLMHQGRNELRWDGRDDGGNTVPSGVYYALLVTPTGQERQPMVLVR
jgi:hypothetical protein